MSDETWQQYSSALTRLLRVPSLRERFEQDLEATVARDELHISSDMADDLKRVLVNLPSSETAEGRSEAQSHSIEQRLADAEMFFDTTFMYIRRATKATVVMSGLIFVVGIGLLVVAAVQAIEGIVPGTAIALAASGLGSIAVAFYRSPVEQIKASAAEMQKANMVLMSYMLGVSLVGRSVAGQDTSKESERLSDLTSELVALLGTHSVRRRRARPQAEGAAGDSPR